VTPGARRPRIHEAELRAPVRAHLEAQGYRVWTDPDGRDFLDVVAARGEEIGLVELKVADWKTVRAQAVVRRALADWVAVAVPSVTLADRILGSLRGPVAPRIGVWVATPDGVGVRRPALPLERPTEGTSADEARTGFRALLAAAQAGEIPEGVAWGGSARRTGRGRSYRLEEFGPGS
jgi:hypothetical protein